MDIKQFQDSRKSQLDEFEKQYSYLKSEYSSALKSSITETDPASQQELVTRVQQINEEMSGELRDILGVLNKGAESFDTTTIDKLTEDLIKYQEDYKKIQQSQDRLKTLKLILNTTKSNLVQTTWAYYLYIGLIVLLCFVITFFVMRVKVWKVSVGNLRGTVVLP